MARKQELDPIGDHLSESQRTMTVHAGTATFIHLNTGQVERRAVWPLPTASAPTQTNPLKMVDAYNGDVYTVGQATTGNRLPFASHEEALEYLSAWCETRARQLREAYRRLAEAAVGEPR